MCGRFTLAIPSEAVLAFLGLDRLPPHAPTPGSTSLLPAPLSPRFNIAPSQTVLGVRALGHGRAGCWLVWGLGPRKRSSSGGINARAEPLFESKAHQIAARDRRCLVAADGFFEWKKSGAKKQPYVVRADGGAPFAMAGIWERWRAPDGTFIEGCAILTTASNVKVGALHDRMPVIVDASNFDSWLDPNVRSRGPLDRLLLPWPDERTEIAPVSTRVNNPANDDEACLTPSEDDEEGDHPKQLPLL